MNTLVSVEMFFPSQKMMVIGYYHGKVSVYGGVMLKNSIYRFDRIIDGRLRSEHVEALERKP